MDPEAPHIEVVHALDGVSRLVERSATLDGSLPLRATQGCQPLLDGNAFGLQVELRLSWRVRRAFGRWSVVPVPAHETTAGWGLPLRDVTPPHAALDARCRALAATLAARGAIPRDGHWHQHLQRAVVEVSQSLRGVVARVFTGLLVRPAKGFALRVSRCANRRSADFDVVETWLVDPDRFTPLVLECVPAGGVTDFVLDHEVATLAAFPREVAVEHVTLAQLPSVGRAHLDFYDAKYFSQKRGGDITRKYRRLVAAETPQQQPDEAPRVSLVCMGAGTYVCESSTRVAEIHGLREGDHPCSAALDYRNEVAFTARWDGHRVWLDWDRAALDTRAGYIEDNWRRAFPELKGEEGQGALWYLTKYFTPHPPGEPHFFTKPAVFVVTPPGWSSLVEGAVGEGYDVMRGLVHTDRFHATPAVFTLHGHGEIAVPAGRVLATVLPLPRSMSAPRVITRTLDEVSSP